MTNNQFRAPLPEGLSPAFEAQAKEPLLILNPPKASPMSSLAGVAKEFAIFTPALVYAKLPEVPNFLGDFSAESGVDVQVFSKIMPEQIFTGLEVDGDTTWNYVLFFMELTHWGAFLSFMSTVGFLNRDEALLYRVRPQDIKIKDVCAKNVLPTATLPITAFCMESNEGCWYFETGPNHPMPRVTYTIKTYDDTIKMFED